MAKGKLDKVLKNIKIGTALGGWENNAKAQIIEWVESILGENETWANPHAESQIIEQESRNDLRKEIRKRLKDK